MTVVEGTTVAFEYTLTVDGKVVDSNVGEEALTYEHGRRQIVPGLEDAMTGMQEGESRQITVAPDRGYGQIEAEAIVEVKKEQVPVEAHKVGAQLMAQDSQGRVLHPVVREVREDSLLLDFNHPLAGKTLVFDIKVLEVKPGGD